MCGIVAAVAQRDVVPLLLLGLGRLEYRGYDSCGVAVHQEGMRRVRSVGRVSGLQQQIAQEALYGHIGVGHTRWATHGAPAVCNAHPHFSRNKDGEPFMSLVHNGIIENYEEIRRELDDYGYRFESGTDTEVVVHLMHHLYDGDLFQTVRRAVSRLRGTFAIAVFCRAEQGQLVGARSGCPLVVGLGTMENFLASDAMALAGTVEQIIYLQDGDIVDVRKENVRIYDCDGQEVVRALCAARGYADAAELGPYRHYMQKEIFEQPPALMETIGALNGFVPELFGKGSAEIFAEVDSVLILACGTSFYAGLTARYWLESIAGIPTNVEIASEYRYRRPTVSRNTLVVAVSQSGETADTLAALKHATALGHSHSLAICNVGTSAIVREAELCYLTRAGAEIGVASTKAFTTQLVGLFLLAGTLAKMRGALHTSLELSYLRNLQQVPSALQAVLALEPLIIGWAERLARKENVLFLGRGVHYPIALEGALKLKEISYIHAEAFPAGELKHGPLALVTQATPVVVIAPNDLVIEKLKSNMQEVRARGGELFVLADRDSCIESQDFVHVINLPGRYGELSPALYVVCLQLLAYHTALARNTDVDKPRNLAKSVTVE